MVNAVFFMRGSERQEVYVGPVSLNENVLPYLDLVYIDGATYQRTSQGRCVFGFDPEHQLLIVYGFSRVHDTVPKFPAEIKLKARGGQKR